MISLQTSVYATTQLCSTSKPASQLLEPYSICIVCMTVRMRVPFSGLTCSVRRQDLKATTPSITMASYARISNWGGSEWEQSNTLTRSQISGIPMTLFRSFACPRFRIRLPFNPPVPACVSHGAHTPRL